jgi:hypothetical protein
MGLFGNNSISESTITNTNNQSSVTNTNISNETTNTNVTDNSMQIYQNTISKLIQSCGMSIEQANEAVNIVKNGEGIQSLDFIRGGDVDQSCVLDTLNNLQIELEHINSNQKSTGEGSKDSISCPICAENIPSSSEVCPICAEPLSNALSISTPPISDSIHNTDPPTFHHIDPTGENTMGEVLEELKKINENLNLIVKHLLLD